MDFRLKNYWALILGASSGFGLAAAKSLSKLGMNICAVHRDRKGSMQRIESEFEKISANQVELLAINTNALTAEGRNQTLEALAQKMGDKGKVRLLLHSIAFGNLKLLAPYTPLHDPRRACELLAEKLDIPVDKVSDAVNRLFNEGQSEMHTLADAPEYNNENMLEDDDLSMTIYAMGTSLLTWVQELHERKLFAKDSRVLGLTSEGNEVAWRAYGAVSAAKTALESISRSIALEFAPYGIRSNIIQAGVTDTPAMRLIPGSDHLKAAMRLRNPMGKLTDPEDVGNFIALMCSDYAAWVNGEIIRVDGGEHIVG